MFNLKYKSKHGSELEISLCLRIGLAAFIQSIMKFFS